MSVLAPIIWFAGNSDPSFVFPTAIATRGPAGQSSRAPAVPSKPGHLALKCGVEDLEVFIGNETLAKARTPGYGEQTMCKYLKAEPENHYFLLGLYIAVQAVLALAASWSPNCVTDRTLTGTVILTLVMGHVIGSAIKHIPIAGRDITKFENFSYVCQDIVKEFHKFDTEPYYKYFERYDGERIHRRWIRTIPFLSPEIFFNPKLYSSDFITPLPEVVDDNIVLSGGSTMFQNFGNRLIQDLKQLVDRRLDASVLDSGSVYKSSGVEVDVISHKLQRYAVRFGGSSLASLPEFYTSCHTKAQYDEIGPSICRRYQIFGSA
ncbi:hypothetical protein C8R42DRAFT_662629, partial [Lentinula raphanica]